MDCPLARRAVLAPFTPLIRLRPHHCILAARALITKAEGALCSCGIGAAALQPALRVHAAARPGRTSANPVQKTTKGIDDLMARRC